MLALALAGVVLGSLFARPPRRSVPAADLRRLVIAAISLYAVGGLASVTHHQVLAGFVYATGIAVCALAAWLSRGWDSEDPPQGEEPVDQQPPPEPDGLPTLDWAHFEAQFHAYSDRRPHPLGVD